MIKDKTALNWLCWLGAVFFLLPCVVKPLSAVMFNETVFVILVCLRYNETTFTVDVEIIACEHRTKRYFWGWEDCSD